MKVKAVIAVLMLVLCQTLFPAALTKTGTGLVYGDDFNDGVLNSQMWSKFSDDVGITEEEKGASVQVSGYANILSDMMRSWQAECVYFQPQTLP
jgi:hypothetical protein